MLQSCLLWQKPEQVNDFKRWDKNKIYIKNLTLHGLAVRPINSWDRRIAHLTFAVLVAIPVTHAINETAMGLLNDNIELSNLRNLTSISDIWYCKSTNFKEKIDFSSKVSKVVFNHFIAISFIDCKIFMCYYTC